MLCYQFELEFDLGQVFVPQKPIYKKRGDSQSHGEVPTINVLDMVELHSPTVMETRELT